MRDQVSIAELRRQVGEWEANVTMAEQIALARLQAARSANERAAEANRLAVFALDALNEVKRRLAKRRTALTQAEAAP